MVIIWLYGTTTYSLLELLVGGWALPLWKMMDFVSDDDIPNEMGKMFQTTRLYLCIYIHG